MVETEARGELSLTRRAHESTSKKRVGPSRACHFHFLFHLLQPLSLHAYDNISSTNESSGSEICT